MQKVQKVQKRQLKNRCTFYYNHLELNDNKNSKKDKKDDDKDDDKDYYKKLFQSHLEKKGKKKYLSNVSRKSDTNNDLI